MSSESEDWRKERKCSWTNEGDDSNPEEPSRGSILVPSSKDDAGDEDKELQ